MRDRGDSRAMAGRCGHENTDNVDDYPEVPLLCMLPIGHDGDHADGERCTWPSDGGAE